MSGHTPGEWQAETDIGSGRTYGAVYGQIPGSEVHFDPPPFLIARCQRLEDAILCAEAPAMLRELKVALEWAEGEYPPTHEAVTHLQAIIAKAEGRS